MVTGVIPLSVPSRETIAPAGSDVTERVTVPPDKGVWVGVMVGTVVGLVVGTVVGTVVDSPLTLSVA